MGTKGKVLDHKLEILRARKDKSGNNRETKKVKWEKLE